MPVANDHDYFVGETGFLVHNEEGCNCLFRGDNRGPDIIFNEGFAPRGPNADLYQYALTNIPSIFVGASSSPGVAGEYGSYIYAIENPGNGIDVNGALGPRSPFPGDLETAFPGGIPANKIRGVTLPCGTMSILNPNFVP